MDRENPAKWHGLVLTVCPGVPGFPSLPGVPGAPRNDSRNDSLSLMASRISDALHVHSPVYFCEGNGIQNLAPGCGSDHITAAHRYGQAGNFVLPTTTAQRKKLHNSNFIYKKKKIGECECMYFLHTT